MRKIDQTIYASDPKRQGNCVSACVATFLGLPLSEVPHFIEHGEAINTSEGTEDRSAWWAMTVGFMAGHAGLWPVFLDRLEDALPHETLFVAGKGKRGVLHQVLYRDGELWHDPHPDRSGVVAIEEILAWRPTQHNHEPTLGPQP